MFTGPRQLTTQDVRDTSTTKNEHIGSIGVTQDGRVYRYSLAGAADLDPGKLCVAATLDSDATNITVAATVAAGATEVVVDAAGAVTANLYDDGYMAVSDATGEGIAYLVNTHETMSASGEMTVYLAEPLEVGLTVDVSEVTLVQNPWSAVVISATDQADMPVGVPNVTIDDADYGWLQTRGVCAVWADEAFAAGDALVTGGGTAGEVEAQDTDDTKAVIGVAMQAGAADEYRPVYLQID